MDGNGITQLRDRLLEATLPNILFDGWTDHALRNGARAAGVAPELVLHAFPDGARDLALHFADWADRRMIERYAAEDTATLQSKAAELQTLILDHPLPASLNADIRRRYDDLIRAHPDAQFVAVRSSATAEDLPTASFAGQQVTF